MQSDVNAIVEGAADQWLEAVDAEIGAAAARFGLGSLSVRSGMFSRQLTSRDTIALGDLSAELERRYQVELTRSRAFRAALSSAEEACRLTNMSSLMMVRKQQEMERVLLLMARLKSAPGEGACADVVAELRELESSVSRIGSSIGDDPGVAMGNVMARAAEAQKEAQFWYWRHQRSVMRVDTYRRARDTAERERIRLSQ